MCVLVFFLSPGRSRIESIRTARCFIISFPSLSFSLAAHHFFQKPRFEIFWNPSFFSPFFLIYSSFFHFHFFFFPLFPFPFSSLLFPHSSNPASHHFYLFIYLFFPKSVSSIYSLFPLFISLFPFFPFFFFSPSSPFSLSRYSQREPPSPRIY